MDQITQLALLLSAGGAGAVVLLLVLIIVALVYDRQSMLSVLAKQEASLESMTDTYNRGNKATADALAGLREMLIEFRTKIK